MKYSVNLRMKNPGPAKYLIDSQDAHCIEQAFAAAAVLLTGRDDPEHFVEIIDNDTNEKIAGFNEGE